MKEFELLKQLHQQYAENDAKKTETLIKFFMGITFVLTGYGLVYSYPFFHKGSMESTSFYYLLQSITILVDIVFVFLSFLCVNFGYATRRDQIIIEKIRKDYISNYGRIFGKLYSASGKSLFSFIPNHYLILYIFINIIIICLAISGCYYHNYEELLFKTATISCNYSCCFFLFALVSIVANVFYLLYKYCKYSNLQKYNHSDPSNHSNPSNNSDPCNI